MNMAAPNQVRPQVSIILPVFNDQDHVSAALESCLAQTLAEIEVVVVDDASTDETASIVESYAARDNRISLIRLEQNMTAFHARRVGISVATAPFVLFLDGDDELVPEAAETALTLAVKNSADVIGFGCQVIRPNGSTGGRYEAEMQPKHKELFGAEIVQKLFPVDKIAQGQLWRYLFDRELLVAAYASLPSGLKLVRVNDLPIAFLALTRAQKYVSTSRVLYRYYFQRGASGHGVVGVDDYQFIASAIDSIDAIAPYVAIDQADVHAHSATYEAVRLSVVGRVLDYVRKIIDTELRSRCLAMLEHRVGRSTLVYACADFCPDALPILSAATSPAMLPGRQVQHVVLRTGNLGTGGVQAVLVAQAQYLVQAGFDVTIVIDGALKTHFRLPDGVRLAELVGKSRGQKIAFFGAFCRDQNVDAIIDHHILYNERWPYFALAAAAEGIPMIGWLHNFALRAIHDGSTRTSFLERHLPLLAMTVVLSEADVTYWKLLGLERVTYLPNPASPFLDALSPRQTPRPAPAGKIEIVWWGRLQESTKRLRELIEIGAVLLSLEVDFRISIIGPDGKDLTADQLRELARRHGIADRVITLGPLHHDELLRAIDDADVFLSTSVIEGYPLALVEAQALGLPLVMYELPWLAMLNGNSGVVAVEQGDRRGAALALAALATTPARYTALSEGSLAAARAALSYDFEALYCDLLRGTLPPRFSPAPTVEGARLLIEQNVRFTERLIRRERRALDRARSAVGDREKKIRRLEEDAVRRSTIVKKAPSVARTGLKGWLMNFLPTSMRQSSYYARHQHSMYIAQHDEIVRGQVAVDRRLARIDAALESLKRETKVAQTVHPSIEDRLKNVEAAAARSLDRREIGG